VIYLKRERAEVPEWRVEVMPTPLMEKVTASLMGGRGRGRVREAVVTAPPWGCERAARGIRGM
jgi:hypothetical protein